MLFRSLLQMVGTHSSFVQLALRIQTKTNVSEVVEASSSTLAGKLMLLGAVLVGTALISHLITRTIRRLFRVSSLPSGSIFVNIARVVTWFLALLLVLDPVFGVSPTAFVTALGVTSLVVSLGMQDTIANLVGGVALTAGKVVQPGDCIEVANNRGEVLDVTLRDTRVRDLLGNVQAIPNSVLNKSALTKLTAREANTVRVNFEVKPGADLTLVEREAKSAALSCLGDTIDFSQPPAVSVYFDGMNAMGTHALIIAVVRTREDLLAAKDALTRALSSYNWLAGTPDPEPNPNPAADKPNAS